MLGDGLTELVAVCRRTRPARPFHEPAHLALALTRAAPLMIAIFPSSRPMVRFPCSHLLVAPHANGFRLSLLEFRRAACRGRRPDACAHARPSEPGRHQRRHRRGARTGDPPPRGRRRPVGRGPAPEGPVFSAGGRPQGGLRDAGTGCTGRAAGSRHGNYERAKAPHRCVDGPAGPRVASRWCSRATVSSASTNARFRPPRGEARARGRRGRALPARARRRPEHRRRDGDDRRDDHVERAYQTRSRQSDRRAGPTVRAPRSRSRKRSARTHRSRCGSRVHWLRRRSTTDEAELWQMSRENGPTRLRHRRREGRPRAFIEKASAVWTGR